MIHPRITTPPLVRSGRRARLSPLLPWVFVIAVAIAMVAIGGKGRGWLHLPGAVSHHSGVARDEPSMVWQGMNPDARYAVTVLRTIDGDTFVARVALRPGVDVTTRVRLRGIDAPELKAMCADELRRAEAAAVALDALLRQGDVTITDIGPDKYAGRIDASVATRATPDVSAAMLAAGHARAYDGGHRRGWCG